jgi:hypothetical protein
MMEDILCTQPLSFSLWIVLSRWSIMPLFCYVYQEMLFSDDSVVKHSENTTKSFIGPGYSSTLTHLQSAAEFVGISSWWKDTALICKLYFSPVSSYQLITLQLWWRALWRSWDPQTTDWNSWLGLYSLSMLNISASTKVLTYKFE